MGTSVSQGLGEAGAYPPGMVVATSVGFVGHLVDPEGRTNPSSAPILWIID